MPDARSRILEGFARLVDSLTWRIDYLALYPCRVVAQRADGTLDLHAEDARLGSPAAVPYRTLLGVSLEVPAGSRILLGFEGGDPSRPVALLWELGTATTVKINGGSVGVARLGDDVTRSAALQTWMAAVTTATGVPAMAGNVIGTIAEGSDVLKVP